MQTQLMIKMEKTNLLPRIAANMSRFFTCILIKCRQPIHGLFVVKIRFFEPSSAEEMVQISRPSVFTRKKRARYYYMGALLLFTNNIINDFIRATRLILNSCNHAKLQLVPLVHNFIIIRRFTVGPQVAFFQINI